MTPKRVRSQAFLLAAICMASSASAVSPADIQQGQQLFSKTWTSNPPIMGNDGLGPLFNATSCATCHNQGGIGGAGDSRFNAQAIGVESIRVSNRNRPTGLVSKAAVNSLVAAVHPGLVRTDGSLITTAPLPHFGGSLAMQQLRDRYRKFSTSEFADEGGALTPADVRENAAASWKWSGAEGQAAVQIEARIFQRNTTALFGAGLIDRIDAEDLNRLEAIQKRHPEVSGHVAATRTGGIGRFGWRGNSESLIDFVDRACAAEMGLQTKRLDQPADIANPRYRNPGIDINDDQVRQMRDFVSALPAPVQTIPADSDERHHVLRGKEVFAAVGCSVCHVETVGPAKGVYSDLLLHDMGQRLYDHDAAEPQVVSVAVNRTYVPVGPAFQVPYYGRPMPMPTLSRTPTPASFTPTGYQQTSRANSASSDFMTIQNMGDPVLGPTTVSGGQRTATPVQEQIILERKLRPSNVSQEWRTPPLWGVADSAPYMHDGRAETLLEAIAMHGGESEKTRERFLNLSFSDRESVLAFLQTLRAPADAPQASL